MFELGGSSNERSSSMFWKPSNVIVLLYHLYLPRDITVTGRDAILGVLLGEHDRRSAHAGTAQRRDVANQSALAVGVSLAHFAVLAPQREHTVADD